MDDDSDVDVKIRERAFKLWQEAGCPDGHHEEFWHQAKAEIEPTPPARSVDSETPQVKARA